MSVNITYQIMTWIIFMAVIYFLLIWLVSVDCDTATFVHPPSKFFKGALPFSSCYIRVVSQADMRNIPCESLKVCDDRAKKMKYCKCMMTPLLKMSHTSPHPVYSKLSIKPDLEPHAKTTKLMYASLSPIFTCLHAHRLLSYTHQISAPRLYRT